MPAYLDTSAFIKLVRSEPESRALRDELRIAKTELISSILLSVEGRRAARRYGKLATVRANMAGSRACIANERTGRAPGNRRA